MAINYEMEQLEQQPSLSLRNSPFSFNSRALPGSFSEGAPVIPAALPSSTFFTVVLPGDSASAGASLGAPNVVTGFGVAGFGGAGLLKAGRSFLSRLAMAARRMAVCSSCSTETRVQLAAHGSNNEAGGRTAMFL